MAAATQRNALLYCRVSTDEQAKGFSLSDQERLMREYAARKAITVVATFRDDYSARSRDELGESFNRPGFTALLAWVRANRGGANLLLFKDWSRFSRDATDALVMIRQLEAFGVECQAVEQPIDWSVPEQVPLLMLYLGMPEAENRRRSLNIRRGMRQAVREGRWVSRPPTGYRRSHDARGKPCLEVDPEAAALVREAFDLVAAGLTMEAARKQIRAKAKAHGLTCFRSGHAFTELLRSRVYVGHLFLPAWRDEPAEWIAGQHEAIIARARFEEVQRAIGAMPRGKKHTLREELPLRGHLLCPETGLLLTGSASRSRNGTRYWYYHAQQRDPSTYRVRADLANDAFVEHLGVIKIDPVLSDWFGEVFGDVLQAHNATLRKEGDRLVRRRVQIQEKLFRADEAYVEGKISEDSYGRLKARYSEELAGVEGRLDRCRLIDVRFQAHLRFGLRLLANLDETWHRLDVAGRRVLVGSIYPDGILFDGEGYRTSPASELLYLLSGRNVSISGATKNRTSGLVLAECPVRWS